jgi:hypothetical protein
MDFEELKIPDYHILFNGKLVAGTREDHIDVYGTSTYLNILEKDGKAVELNNLKDEIHRISEEIRGILTHILDEDDSYEKFDMNKYKEYTMFNYGFICKDIDEEKLFLLLPPSVSESTFNTIYPAYEEIIHSEKSSVLREKVLVESKEEKKTNFFSSFKGPKIQIIYTDDCRQIIKKIKWFIRQFMTNDDYIINAYKYLPFTCTKIHDDRMIRLNQIQ